MIWGSRGKIILLIGTAVLLLVMLFFGARTFLTPKNAVEQLKKEGISFPQLKDFIIESMETREVSELLVTELTARNDEAVLQLDLIQNMDEKLSSLYLEEKRVGIESLFINQPAHYPGIITRETECPTEFQPEKGAIGGTAYYIMYANDRFFYGVCVPDLIKYRSITGLLYCKEQSVFVEAKFFFLPESFNRERALELLSSFQCS